MEIIKKYLQDIFIAERIAGMSVAITDKNKIIYAEGFGVESIERPDVLVTPESLFRIASITKIVTGMTILSLVEEGKLSLNTPIKQVLPWLSLKDKHTEEYVTLAHLLSHTSGFPAEYTPNGPYNEEALEQSLRDTLPYLDMQFPLGEGYIYSNWGIRLASLVSEKVSGMKFSQLATERVLAPLGMHRTLFDLHIAATYPICLGHIEEGGAYKVVHKLQENAARYAAGGLFSNSVDLCCLARCLLNEGIADNGNRILHKASIEEMMRARGQTPSSAAYGITLFQDRYKDTMIYYHPGSAPPYATSLLIHPDSGIGIVTLMNTERNYLRCKIPETILDILIK